MIRVLHILLLCCLLFNLSYAQERPGRNALFIEPKVRFGPILDIHPGLPEHGPAISGEVNIGWQTLGKQHWNRGLKFPQVGVMLSVTDLGNPSVTGQEFSMVPNLAYRFLQRGNFELLGMVGLGFSWYNKPYDRISNPENLFIGSRVTNKTILGVNADYSTGRHLTFSAGLSYLHYSNGHNQLPNVGINIPSVHVGVKYYPGGKPASFYTADTLIAFDKKWRINVRAGLGVHEFGDPIKPVGGPKYPVYNGSVYLSKRFSPIVNFHTGIHFNYYTSFYDYLAFHDLQGEDRHLRSMTFIAFGGIEFLMGHFSFTTQMGFYLYNPTYSEIHSIGEEPDIFKEKAKNFLTYKFGAQYYLFTTRSSTRFNPWLGIFLKSNAGQADFAEISIGCAF